MQLTQHQNSIVSYAGIPKSALFSFARQALSHIGEELPPRFVSFFPLFPFELIQNMDYVGPSEGNAATVAPSGFSIDPAEYFGKLYAQMPTLFEADNYKRNFDYEGHFTGRSVFTVDQQWALHFPQYSPFLGEKLMIHLLGGGHQAVCVPESWFPRGVGMLRAAEQRMQITQRAQQFVQYATGRIAAGEAYNAEAFGAEYLALTGLETVMIRQSELGRTIQDLSIAMNLQGEPPPAALFTEHAKRVENVRQYTPYLYACDTFEAASISRHTARLCQPCLQGNDFVSDLWIPYQDLSQYVNKQHMVLDMARLCHAYQIAPIYDPQTGGGRYPDALRVALVRDRDLPIMMGDVLNNPAYGSGMNTVGMIARQVYLPGSRELLRQRKLSLEEVLFSISSEPLSPQEYRRQLVLSALQEAKGALVDAMYRREAALSQLVEGTPAYQQAKAELDISVQQCQLALEATSQGRSHQQVSGYDADIDYLRRKQWDREGVPEDEAREPILFTPDPKREQSIESGYAMRASLQRMAYAQVYDPSAPVEGEASPQADTPGSGAAEAEAPSAAIEAPAATQATPVPRVENTPDDTNNIDNEDDDCLDEDDSADDFDDDDDYGYETQDFPDEDDMRGISAWEDEDAETDDAYATIDAEEFGDADADNRTDNSSMDNIHNIATENTDNASGTNHTGNVDDRNENGSSNIENMESLGTVNAVKPTQSQNVSRSKRKRKKNKQRPANASRQPASLQAIAPKNAPTESTQKSTVAKPSLADIVHKDSHIPAVSAVNKAGKMAALVKKAPSSGEQD